MQRESSVCNLVEILLTWRSLGYSMKGWIDGTITPVWIEKFAAQTQRTAAGHPRLLIVDGHVSHYAQAFLEKARQYNIHVLCYPAHTTHQYQALDLSLFSPLKAAFAKARDRWERTHHEAVGKSNFLAVLGEAVVEAFTPANIRAAMADAGTWPINPAVVTPAMLAPSRESSWQTHLPLVPPTPVRHMAQLLRLSSTLHDTPQTPQAARHRAGAAPVAMDPHCCSSDDDAEDEQDAEERDRSAASIPAPPVTPRTTLRSSSVGFLVEEAPITSEMSIPRPRIALPPNWVVPQELRELQPITQREAALVAALHEAAKYVEKNRTAAIDAHAVMVLQHTYCDRVKGQLAASERKAQKGPKCTRLLADGLPHVLTDDEFMERHRAHDEDMQARAHAQRQRENSKITYQAAVAAWTLENAARATRNELKHLEWQAAVVAWEEERDRAKAAHERPGWAKPKRGSLERGPAKPKLKNYVHTEEEAGEDFTRDLEVIGEEMEEEGEEDSD